VSTYALIPAAGKGTRMDHPQNKLLLPLGSIPVIIHTLRVFQNAASIDGIIMAVNVDMIGFYETLCADYGITTVKKIVEGGYERQDSVRAMLREAGEPHKVAIHDGARPFLSAAHLDAVLSIPDGYEGTVLGVPLNDTLKIVDDEGLITRTPDRRLFWLAQTPQVFHFQVLREACEKAHKEALKVTDDAALIEHYGGRVKMIQGSGRNIKITTPEDLLIGETFLTHPEPGRTHGRS